MSLFKIVLKCLELYIFENAPIMQMYIKDGLLQEDVQQAHIFVTYTKIGFAKNIHTDHNVNTNYTL